MAITSGLIKTRISPAAALLISAGFSVVLVVIDLATGPYLNLAIFKSVALLVAAAARSRKFLWIITAALLVTTFGVMWYERGEALPEMQAGLVANRCFTAITLILVSMILDAWIRSDARAAEAAGAVEEQNHELAAREEEVTRQNEELQSQTEELERQSEELRVANEELAQRERMLETLLDLSRAMHVGMARATRSSASARRSASSSTGPEPPRAILMKEPAGVRVRCHYGSARRGCARISSSTSAPSRPWCWRRTEPGTSKTVAAAGAADSAAGVRRTDGRGVWRRPLMVRGKSIGTLEVYSRERRQVERRSARARRIARRADSRSALKNAQLFRGDEDSGRASCDDPRGRSCRPGGGDRGHERRRFNTAGGDDW
jgi:TolA-binding protein